MRLGDTACRTLAAVLTLHARNGRVTVRDVAAEVGMGSSVVFRNLGWLRAAGLVAWEPGTNGTIRPTCTIAPPNEHACALAARLNGQEPSGPGAASTAPARGQPPETPRGANMAERYPRSPSHARGQA